MTAPRFILSVPPDKEFPTTVLVLPDFSVVGSTPMRIEIRLKRRERRQLEKTMRKSKDAEFRVRCQIVLLYAKDLGCSRIAELVGCAPSTAVRVAHRFLDEGIAGLYDRRVENGVEKVDERVLEAIARLLERSPETYGWSRPTWSRELIARTLAERGITRISVTTVARALATIGARWKAARPIVLCPWSASARTRRIRAIRRLIEQLPRDEVAFYEDELDVHLNPKVGRDWALRGRQPIVVTPGKNKKRYVAGALEVRSKRLVWVAAERKNIDLFLALVKELLRRYRSKRRIHLVLDNFAIHHAKRTQRELALLGDRLVLHFLPPYCPNANKIERVWRDLHANVTRNHRCKTINQLMRNVERWLNLPLRIRTHAHEAVTIAA